jgi:hypothetical protein
VSAFPTPASVVEPRRIAVPAPLVATGRTLALVALALLVPGEAARIADRLGHG